MQSPAVHQPSLIKVLWDIENIVCDPAKLKRALRAYLDAQALCFVGDRTDYIAYHDPRRGGGLTAEFVDRLVSAPITLVDKGPKKGLSDLCLVRDCRNAIDDVGRGLRLRCVVIISSDSDYSAAGLYDAVENVGIPLVVIHGDSFKRHLLDGASFLRAFIHLDDLLEWLPAQPVVLRPPVRDVTAREERSPRSAAGALRDVFPSSPLSTPLLAAGAVPSDAAGGGPRRPSVASLDTEEIPKAETNLEAVAAAVKACIEDNGGGVSGAKLGQHLRSRFNYAKLKPLLGSIQGVEIIPSDKAEGGDIQVRWLPGAAT